MRCALEERKCAHGISAKSDERTPLPRTQQPLFRRFFFFISGAICGCAHFALADKPAYATAARSTMVTALAGQPPSRQEAHALIFASARFIFAASCDADIYFHARRDYLTMRVSTRRHFMP